MFSLPLHRRVPVSRLHVLKVFNTPSAIGNTSDKAGTPIDISVGVFENAFRSEHETCRMT